MSTVQAWQHIFSNVEKEQSPQKRGGFQTLFYSHADLQENEVSEMEGRLLYFPSSIEPVKRLFFTTSTGKQVVSQIVSLSDPDQYGRKGRYLAHSFIFEPEAFTTIGGDPFRVFQSAPFITTVPQALEAGVFKTGDIPPVSLSLPDQNEVMIAEAKKWSSPELKKLTSLALGAKTQAEQRQAITFIGQPNEIEAAVKAAFVAIPVKMRPYCTFDTYFYKCNLVAAYFWGVGLPERPLAFKFALVDAAAKTIQGDLLPPQTAYDRWVLAALNTNDLNKLVADKEIALLLCTWLAQKGGEGGPPETLSDGLIEAVFEANRAIVRQFLDHRLGEHLPQPLVQRIVEDIYQPGNNVATHRQLKNGFTLVELQSALYQNYTDSNLNEPDRTEQKALDSLLNEHPHQGLSLCLAYWRSPKRDLLQILGEVSEELYQQFSMLLLRNRLVDPFNLLLPGRTNLFTGIYLKQSDKDIYALIKVLLERDQTEGLPLLNAHLFALSEKELRKLNKTLTKYENLPAIFTDAVKQKVDALPEKKSLLGHVRSFWQSVRPGGDDETTIDD